MLLVICKSLNLSSFLFLLFNFYGRIEMNFSWLVASIAVPPYLFFKKTPLLERSLLFFINRELLFTENRFIKCTWFRVFCTCFLCWVCRLIKSERSGESPSLSARKLCKTRILNESFCKERGGLESLKNSFWKRLAKYIFLLFGDCQNCISTRRCKIRNWTYSSDSKQWPKFRLHVLFWVSRLKKQAIGCVAFA